MLEINIKCYPEKDAFESNYRKFLSHLIKIETKTVYVIIWWVNNSMKLKDRI